ncbi:DUF2110 family protein [Methanolobus sp. ZRKC3]|uniref:DUF2110 family protein n=1 Tax=Methanolobus sp. ZRKC3 TaxID=3125786 RepID=UPI003249FEA2
MVKTQLAIKIYGSRERAIHSAKVLMDNELKELDAESEISVSENDWLSVEITGEDDEFASNFLAQKYGRPTRMIKNGSVHKGFIHKIDKDMLQVDIGTIINIPKENLNFFGAGDAQQIAARFGIIQQLPVEIEISDASKAEGRFTKVQADKLWAWKKSGLDHVVANSVTRSELKAAIKKTGHSRDIYGIERLGLMEHVITCREKTDGPGIVAAIGKYLKGELGVIKAA